MSKAPAAALIDCFPTAATSLHANSGAYTLQYPGELIADWFYPVEGVFDDSGAVLAKFFVARDLSAVYRGDDGIEPVLLFGSAQPMLDAQVIPPKAAKSDPGENPPDWVEAPQPVVMAVLEGGTNRMVGQQGWLTAAMPWQLPCTLTAKSSNPSVIAVDASGMVTAVSQGTAVLSGTITIDDGKKEFSMEVSAEPEYAEGEAGMTD